MVTRSFGKTGWRIAEIGLGCNQFGGPFVIDGKPGGWSGVDDTESIATLQRAVELGVNFFDTADQYGHGHSEQIVGTALRPCRDRVYLATKVGQSWDTNGSTIRCESRPDILRACEASLRRLQTDYIDLYQCHLPQTERWTEFLDAFDTLRRQGKLRYFGISTNDLDMVKHFDERGGLAAVQFNYNLLDRRAERTVLPYCRERGIAAIVCGPLSRGRLTGKYDKDTQFPSDDRRSLWNTGGPDRDVHLRHMATIEQLKPVAQNLGLSLAHLSLKFVLSHVAVSVVIPGARNRTQLQDNIAASALPALNQKQLLAIHQALAA